MPLSKYKLTLYMIAGVIIAVVLVFFINSYRTIKFEEDYPHGGRLIVYTNRSEHKYIKKMYLYDKNGVLIYSLNSSDEENVHPTYDSFETCFDALLNIKSMNLVMDWVRFRAAIIVLYQTDYGIYDTSTMNSIEKKIRALILKPSPAFYRSLYIGILGKTGLRDNATVILMKKLLKDKDVFVRGAAILTLSEIVNPEKKLEIIIENIYQEKSNDIMEVYLKILADIDSPDTIKILKKLRHKDWNDKVIKKMERLIKEKTDGV